MPKRIKNKKTQQFAAIADDKANSLPGEIKKAAENLSYISETDAPVEYFDGGKAEAVTTDVLSSNVPSVAGKEIKEKGFEDFFAPLIEMQDWYGKEEKETAEKYAALKDLLEKNLYDLKVFKVGQTEVDVYIVGLDVQNILTGVTTKAVET